MNPDADDSKREIANLRAKVNLLRAMNAMANLHLRDERNRLNQRINDMEASRSWRLTTPLRKASEWLKALRQR